MKKPFALVLGIAAILFGGLFLLYLFAWCNLLPPELRGTDRWLAVLRKMFGEGAVWGTLIGLALVLLGVVLVLLAAFSKRDDAERRKATDVAMWAVVVALGCLLLAALVLT